LSFLAAFPCFFAMGHPLRYVPKLGRHGLDRELLGQALGERAVERCVAHLSTL
jgi:hypothetical protein